MSLDLDNGDEELANLSPRERRQRARQAAAQEKNKPASKKTARKPASARVESEVLSRLHRVLDRIALTLDARGDDELASVVRQDADAMAQGLASLTHNVKFLMGPLIMALNLVEPILAFGRVTRVLWGRWVERQTRIAEERAAREQESSPVVTQ